MEVIMRAISAAAVLLPALIAGAALGADIGVPGDCPSIQKAIDKAAKGDTVRVGPGEWKEFLTLKDGVALVGAGSSKTKLKAPEAGGCVVTVSDAELCWIDGVAMEADAEGRCVDACNSRLTISNSAVAGAKEGVALRDCYQTVIRNCFFWNNATGIRALESRATIAMNRFDAMSDARFNVYADKSNFCAERNVLKGAEWGVWIAGSGVSFVWSNVFMSPSQGGVYIEGKCAPKVMNNVFCGTDRGVFAYFGKAAISHNDMFDVKTPYVLLGEEGDEEAFKPSPGTGEMSADPMFADSAKDDYRLGEKSPCAGAGEGRGSFGSKTKIDVGCFPLKEKDVIGPMDDVKAREACRPDPDSMVANYVKEEYADLARLRCSCGGRFTREMQGLGDEGGKPVDKLHVKCGSCGKQRVLKFDISRFFGDY